MFVFINAEQTEAAQCEKPQTVDCLNAKGDLMQRMILVSEGQSENCQMRVV